MPMMQPMIWFIIFVVLLVVELATLGLVTVWFAGGALVAFLLSLFIDNIFVEVGAFLVVSILLLVFTKPLVAKYINGKRVKTNVESIIGKVGKTIEEIDNFNETGVVVLAGQEWMARSKDGNIIPADTKVVVREISGVKVFVEKCEDDTEVK